MNRATRTIVIAAVAVAAALAGYLTNRGTQPMNGVVASAGDTLMALRLPDADGSEQALEQWRGKVMVVNYWATWCAPCIKEIPEFAAVSRHFSDSPVQFVGIGIDTPQSIATFGAQHDVPYPLLVATYQTLALTADLGNAPQALPFTVILDQQGKIRHAKLGRLSETELTGKIRALLPH